MASFLWSSSSGSPAPSMSWKPRPCVLSVGLHLLVLLIFSVPVSSSVGLTSDDVDMCKPAVRFTDAGPDEVVGPCIRGAADSGPNSERGSAKRGRSSRSSPTSPDTDTEPHRTVERSRQRFSLHDRPENVLWAWRETRHWRDPAQKKRYAKTTQHLLIHQSHYVVVGGVDVAEKVFEDYCMACLKKRSGRGPQEECAFGDAE